MVKVVSTKSTNFIASLSPSSQGEIKKMDLEMATHSSILAWRIPWTEETGWLQPTGPPRVGHD